MSYVEQLTEKDESKKHFSSFLLSGDRYTSFLEAFLIGSLLLIAFCPWKNKFWIRPGTMFFEHFAVLQLALSLFRKVYNFYLESCFMLLPSLRTQPLNEHRLKQEQDLSGRTAHQLKLLVHHDRITLITQFVLQLALYFFISGFFPSANALVEEPFVARFGKLVINHLILSFNMYWAHRYLHTNKFLFEKIHSIHHWAKHPLSRNTYEDHWLDNFINAVVGEVIAQLICPLDFHFFIFSRVFRIMESLEKHSGLCGIVNIAHSLQKWIPFAQMPHHHDWHHEGFKGCNYTFTSIGGIWDLIFGTRKTGIRAAKHPSATTMLDAHRK